MKKYNPTIIEKKWQDFWATNGTFTATENSNKEKKYVLVEFPFPSGDGLHMGHLRSYTAADVLSRYYRMTGKEVMYPIGYDAFGLPAENYAIKHGVQPKISTAKNIENIRKQCQRLGYSFDWTREVNTTDPEYYKWTQWLFLQFYKAGLAYEATGLINWCPKDMTGLANEEVINGHCERCGTQVEKKELRQWYLKITEYAEKLLQGLDNLPEWPDAVKLQQANWIGKSEGAEIDFKIGDHSVTVFTTRPDTIFGATYLVLAPEHPLIQDLKNSITNFSEVEKYIEQAKAKQEMDRASQSEDKDKTSVELKGVSAINPATNEPIPVWTADYVLNNYGTAAIMSVPAHDERDYAFAKKFNLPIKRVVEPKFIASEGTDSSIKPDQDFVHRDAIVAIIKNPKDETYLCVSWKEFLMHGLITGGVDEGEDIVEAAKREILEETGYKNVRLVNNPEIAIHSLFYQRVKKQNRWARFQYLIFELENEEREPIDDEEALLHDLVWLKKEELQDFFTVVEGKFIIDLINNPDFIFTGEGVLHNSGEFDGMDSTEALPKMAAKYGTPKTTYKLRDWVFSRQRYWGEPIPLIHCDKDGIVAVPNDQLPVVLPEVDKYEPTGTGESPLAAIDEWVNTSCPQCGGPAKRETNTMPQWAGSSWYYLRYTDPKNDSAFAAPDKLKYWLPVDTYFGGMEHTTLHLLYSRFWNIFLYDQGLVPVSEPYSKRVPHGIILAEDGSKMSKSKGNVVNPDSIVKQYGADTTRMYELFLGPHGASVAWSDKGIVGVARFLDRVWSWVNTTKPAKADSQIVEREINILIKKITEDIESFSYNTAVSSFMKFHNEVKDEVVALQTIQTFLKLLYPFAPHIAEELFQILNGEDSATNSLQYQPWPEYDPSKIIATTVKIAVQVNGKLRDTLEVAAGSDQAAVQELAMQSEKIKSHVAGTEPKRIVYIPDKLLNIVI